MLRTFEVRPLGIHPATGLAGFSRPSLLGVARVGVGGYTSEDAAPLRDPVGTGGSVGYETGNYTRVFFLGKSYQMSVWSVLSGPLVTKPTSSRYLGKPPIEHGGPSFGRGFRMSGARRMVPSMSLVWISSRPQQRPRFHSSSDCYHLTQRSRIGGTPLPPQQVDLRDLDQPRPCHTCYSDIPVIRMAKRYCNQCNGLHTRPCAHNGGVPVYVTYQTTYRSFLREPGDEITKMIYVWPSRVHHYTN